MENKHESSIIGLDLLRGLAAFAVLLFHVRAASFVEYHALPGNEHSILVKIFLLLTRFGGEAVFVFFSLSGFLVCGQIIRRLRTAAF